MENWLNNNELSISIWRNKYCVNNESFDNWLNRVSGNNTKIKQLIKDKKFLFGGRTLANRGIPNAGSFSNCYSIGFVPDSLDGIMDVASKIATTFKAQGGQGLSLSNIRPKGSMINNQFESDGIVPFMNIFNTVTESVSQGGSRKGALMMSLSAWHKEINDFITIKNDLNKINKANLSVEIDDNFMNSLHSGNVEVTASYENTSLKYTINPGEVFDTLCESAWKSAEPGILFVDQLRNYNIMEYVDSYNIETTNPCGEQPLPKNGACNLCSINVANYVLEPFTNQSRIDYDTLKEDIHVIVEEMDKVLEENAERHALQEQKWMALTYRNIGIGIMGLADLFVKMQLRYGSAKSVELARSLMKFIFRESVYASVNLAKKLGNFPGYDSKVWESSIIKNAFNKEEIELLKLTNKLRNCSLLSVAPTGSIGTMLNISTGVEPFFALSYNRRTESLGEQTFKVEISAIEEYRKITGNKKDLPDYFITSAQIHWKDRINIQAALQEFTDTAISSTINLPKSCTLEEIKELYKYAWEKKLKGVTIYREGSRNPILSTSDTKEVVESVLNRGYIIPTGNDWIGLKKTLVTGCGTLHCEAFFDPDNGELRECYLSKGSTGGCNNFMIGLSRMISLSARGGVGIDKILDQLKSCGTCPSYAVRTATKKDTSKGSSCPVAVGNALREMQTEIVNRINNCVPNKVSIDIIDTTEYQECPSCKKKGVVNVGGCNQCVHCGWSKCS